MEPRIIHQDNVLLVIDKPSGWIVNEASTTGQVPVVQEWLKKNFDYGIAASKDLRSGIVHRLDKETSGVLLVAKTPDAFSYLQSLFKERKVKKSYKALVHGKVKPAKGIINENVGRLPWNRERFGVLPGGREAVTKYETVFYCSNTSATSDIYTLLDLFPETGRTHQIRIHLKHLGHPIVSDSFYAGRKTSRKDRKWCPRLFLHAASISFKHPNGKDCDFKTDLPIDLAQVLDSLEKINN
jgi:23S rRNA pseudouridine1911/1915/1917 synthase